MLFAVPFYYLFHTRLVWWSERISWFLINPLPIFALTLATGRQPTFALHMAFFVLGFVVWQAIYEIGYIENDAITTKREREPTLRLTAEETAAVEGGLGRIVALRAAIAGLSMVALVWIASHGDARVHLIWFALVLAISRTAFIAHNRIRARFNVATFGVLSATKYLAVPVLMAANDDMMLTVVSAIVMFPLLRTIEHATKNKFVFGRLKSFVGDFAIFRVKYYLTCFLAACAIAMYFPQSDALLVAMILAYFLVYRLAVWGAVRLNIARARRHSAY